MQEQYINDDAIQVLTFTLGCEEYGINILQVQEVRAYDSVTAIANAPRHIKGVINLRGVIVPIIDMRISFGFDNPIYDKETAVIILNIDNKTMGVVIDTVSDVLTVNAAEIKPPPQMCPSLNTEHLIGMAIVTNRMLTLIDIKQFLSSEDISLLDRIVA